MCNLFVVCEPPRDPGPPGTVAWHLARLLGRPVAQIGLEDRLLPRRRPGWGPSPRAAGHRPRGQALGRRQPPPRPSRAVGPCASPVGAFYSVRCGVPTCGESRPILGAARHSQSAGADARNRNRSITPSRGQLRGGGHDRLPSPGDWATPPSAGCPMARWRQPVPAATRWLTASWRDRVVRLRASAQRTGNGVLHQESAWSLRTWHTTSNAIERSDR